MFSSAGPEQVPKTGAKNWCRETKGFVKENFAPLLVLGGTGLTLLGVVTTTSWTRVEKWRLQRRSRITS
jgi:hypothetical protein